jgi:Alkaline phosphatase PhoX
MFRARRSILATIAAGALAAAVVASVASGGPNAAGYNTAQAPMVTFLNPPAGAAPLSSTADAIISVGDTIGGYTFESIPDGVSVYPRGNGRADVYVNHETSTVPFPYSTPFGGATPEANQNDFTNSEVSLLEMNQHKTEINKASKAISSVQNLHRFCASFLATAAEGFKHPILFANEEAQDWVFRTGTSWPGPTSIAPATPGAEQLGVVYAHDVKSGKTKPIYSMGRHNHESAVAIPGFDDIVVLSGDDTFQTATTAPGAASQLYMYTATDSDELWDDAGTLHAFVADGTPPTADNDYFDLQPGDTIEGHFLPVPELIAKGKAADGHELTRAVDFPNYAAPAGGPSVPPDGPQWVLDQWGNVNPAPNTPDVGDVPGNDNDVFDFIRIEDIAYDKNESNVVYLADSGRAETGAAAPATKSTNGRIYKLVLDPDGTGDPTVAEISILVQGDDSPTGRQGTPPLSLAALNEIHQPDNLETTGNGNLLVTEDPSSANQYDAGSLNSTAARLWMVPLDDPEGGKKPLLAVNQALDENANAALGAIDVDAATAARLGAWESSGIVDASAAFGPGAFFLTIQAHSYWVQKLAGPDRLDAAGSPNPNTNGPDFFYKKEGGQLILLKMPGV